MRSGSPVIRGICRHIARACRCKSRRSASEATCAAALQGAVLQGAVLQEANSKAMPEKIRASGRSRLLTIWTVSLQENTKSSSSGKQPCRLCETKRTARVFLQCMSFFSCTVF